MNTPFFSVLIANYNNGKYLQEAIDSVLAQTYTNWEVIIVDDGSTDNSQNIYNKYKDNPQFHIYYNGENKGCGYTKHQCAVHANGEYCGYLDPDDVLLPNALDVIATLLTNNDKASLAVSRYYFCDIAMNILGEGRPLVIPEGISYFENHDYRAENFAGFRKKSYIKMGGIDVTAHAGVDADLYFRLEEVGEMEISHEITYKYRIYSESITGNHNMAFYWNCIVRHNTCLRRGLKPELYSGNDFVSLIEEKDKEIYRLSHSHAFKFGRFLLQPYHWAKRAIKKIQQCNFQHNEPH